MPNTLKPSRITKKILVIGIDGATYDILRPLIQSGLMPNLEKLQAKSAYGVLHSTMPPFSAPAWATFATGKNPGKHGVFSFLKFDQSFHNSYEQKTINRLDVEATSLWKIVGDTGRKVGIINLPLTYPPESVNGFIISGMLTPRNSKAFTYPPELASKLSDYRIDYEINPNTEGEKIASYEHKKSLLLDFETLISKRAETARTLLKEQNSDLFVVIFTETDRLQHFFWDYLTNNKATGDPELMALIQQVIRRLDEGIGMLLAEVDNETSIIILSDHGFGPAPTKTFYVNAWLMKHGYLKVKELPDNWVNPYFWAQKFGISAGHIRQTLRKLIGGVIVNRAQRQLRSRFSLPIDWENSQAYYVNVYSFIGGIEINLRGLKPSGCVQPGPEYEKLRNSIREKLLSLTDLQTGENLVKNIFFREEIYSGEHVLDAPDIIFELNPTYSCSAALGRKSLVEDNYEMARSGEHRPEGILIMVGPGIKGGHKESSSDIQDIAPTILYQLGIPIPEDMDGKVLRPFFESEIITKHPIVYQPAKATESSTESVFESDEDKETVEARLRDLGYLD